MTFKSTLKSVGAAAVLSGLLIGPALAQTANNGMANGNNSTLDSNAKPASNSAPSGTLEKTHGLWRAGAVNGADVYGSAGQQIGTIDNLLIDSSGKVTDAVISVGGIAGVGGKLVEVPFSKLDFKPSDKGTSANMQASNSASGQTDYSIVFPNQTADSLKAMPAFSYDKS
jgi:hypothetical protein